MIAWDATVILLLYYPQCWLEGLRNTAAVIGAASFGTQVRGFKPDRSSWIFQGEKTSSARLPSEGN